MLKKCKQQGCFENATCRDGRCANHTTGLRPRGEYGCHVPGPRTDKPHLGIEIECFATTSQEYRALCAQTHLATHDGSLPQYGAEFRICLPSARAPKMVVSIAERLVGLGARVNGDCGLHVHMDMRQIPREWAWASIAWLTGWEEYWFSLIPPSRRTSSMCGKIEFASSQDHYQWAHYCRAKKTIEIRLHPGTINAHKLRSWTMALASLQDYIQATYRNNYTNPKYQQYSGDYVWPSLTACVADVARLTEPFHAIEDNSPTPDQLQDIFGRVDPIAIEYLLARRRGNGVMRSARAVANGLNEE